MQSHERPSAHVQSLDMLEGDTLSRLVPASSHSRGSQRSAPSRDSPMPVRVAPVPQNFVLSKFLRDIGLEDYEDLLRETGFDDYRSVLAIEEDDMDAIGMITGHKRKLLRAVADLNDAARETGTSADRAPRSPEKASPVRRDSKSSSAGPPDEEGALTTKKMKRRRRVKPPPPPPSLEEKAAAAPSEVIMEQLFPGDGLNFPQDGEIVRLHFIGKVCTVFAGFLLCARAYCILRVWPASRAVSGRQGV